MVEIGFRVDDLKKPCPVCGDGNLRRVTVSHKPAAYYCIPGDRDVDICKLEFEVAEIRPRRNGSFVVKGKAVNPVFSQQQGPESFRSHPSLSKLMRHGSNAYYLDSDNRVIEEITEAEMHALNH
jgi:hypothetical protein